MRVLIVKTSSLGDVIHTLPALTDALAALPGIRFDWVVEEVYAEIPAWHPGVEQVIPVALRRWRRQPLAALLSGEWSAFRRRLRESRYTQVIDAQGLLKSALITAMARGLRCGLDWASAREPLAALAYRKRLAVAKDLHAVTRVRRLLAGILGYPYRAGMPDYGLRRERFQGPAAKTAYVMFLHGTLWPTKQWPEEHWIALGQLVNQAGASVHLPWGNVAEQARATRIAGALRYARVLQAMNLQAIAIALAGAAGAVGVDTGLSHLAAALEVPAVTLYGATHPALTGAFGKWQQNLSAAFPCAPCLSRACDYRGAISAPHPACYSTLLPAAVWQALQSSMAARRRALFPDPTG